VVSVSFCGFVCLFFCQLVYLRYHTAKLYQFLCTLTVAVTRSFSDGVAIRCVLPVLCMASRFRILGHWRVRRIPINGERVVQQPKLLPRF